MDGEGDTRGGSAPAPRPLCDGRSVRESEEIHALATFGHEHLPCYEDAQVSHGFADGDHLVERVQGGEGALPPGPGQRPGHLVTGARGEMGDHAVYPVEAAVVVGE